MCSIRIIKKVPDLAENFINPAASLLKEKHHGVLITGVQLCTDLCKVSSEALEYFRKVNWLWLYKHIAIVSESQTVYWAYELFSILVLPSGKKLLWIKFLVNI